MTPSLLLTAALLAALPAEAGTQPASAPAVVAFEHLRADLAARRIALDARVAHAEGPVEFLLCLRNTKDYESVLATDAPPSQVHAALLALGLSPGKPAQWSTGPGEPAFLPPRGAAVSIRLRWRDEQGDPAEADASDWLTAGPGGDTAPPADWIFVGSLVLPDGTYWADAEGGIVSVANFASAVIDVPFESTSANALLEFAADGAAVPPPGTPVEVVIEPRPGARDAPHARALLELDALGRMRLDGRPVRLPDLRPWAIRYVERHERGMVLLRAAPDARVGDLVLARRRLAEGGVREFDQDLLPPAAEPLPRTDAQLREAMADWRARFARPDDFLLPPAEHARRTLERIDAATRQLEAFGALWARYRRELAALLGAREPAIGNAEAE